MRDWIDRLVPDSCARRILAEVIVTLPIPCIVFLAKRHNHGALADIPTADVGARTSAVRVMSVVAEVSPSYRGPVGQ